ncbi:expressed protein [Phakopsora pachyrhizi]|uniref:Expressed protein n=1 Tax=Phakopsora pachyrhizi TaxID=170000 RepID=A0AAV0B299_PHAPC|nr:expressed protein [Phakopsora pachyrhizi]
MNQHYREIMVFRKAVIYLCLGALKILSTNAAFSKSNDIKTLDDIAEGSMPENPFFSQDNFISCTKNTSQIEKQSQAEGYINFPDKNAVITQFVANNKRDFKETLENREAKPVHSPVNLEEHKLTPSIVTDQVDDLMFFATELDDFPTYLMEFHPAEIQPNSATASDGLELSYHDYHLQDNDFGENNSWLINQSEPLGFQSSTVLNGAAEIPVPEHQNLGAPSLDNNQLFCSLFEAEPTAVSEENTYNAWASNFGPTLHEEARESYKEGQISNESIENLHSLNFNYDSNILKIGLSKAQNDVFELEDLPVLEKQLSQTLSPGEKYIIENESLLKSRRSHSKAPGRQSRKITKNTKDKEEEEKNIKTASRSENSLKNVMDEFKLKLGDLSESSSSKGSLNLFLKTIDNFADNMSTEDCRKSRKRIKLQHLEIYSQKSLVASFLADSGIPICQSLLNKLINSIKKRDEKFGQKSDFFFFELINDQIKRNFDQNLYIFPHQVSLFLNVGNSDFKVENLDLEKAPTNRNYYSDHLAKKICMAIKLIPWKELSISDRKLEIFEKREIYTQHKRVKRFDVNYGRLPRMRFELRKLFKVYSTLINKIFCIGEKDLHENFHNRQIAAIDFFDDFMSLLEIDSADTAKYFITYENLPLNENVKAMFSKNSLNSLTEKFQFRICNGDRTKIDIIWKIIALWLAKDKYKYYEAIYCSDDVILLHFKQFFNSIFFYITSS